MSAAVARTADELYADSLRAGTAQFAAQAAAAQKRARIERLSKSPKVPSPAIQAAHDAMAVNARKFAELRLEEMRRLRIEQQPARSGRYGKAMR